MPLNITSSFFPTACSILSLSQVYNKVKIMVPPTLLATDGLNVGFLWHFWSRLDSLSSCVIELHMKFSMKKMVSGLHVPSEVLRSLMSFLCCELSEISSHLFVSIKFCLRIYSDLAVFVCFPFSGKVWIWAQ